MKKVLLFAILALSINAFAQTNRSTSYNHHPTSNSMENVLVRLEDLGLKTFNIHPEINYRKFIKYQAPQPLSLIQIMDSIYQWQLDTISMAWVNYSKIIDMVYDANNNQTSELLQNWNGSAWENYYKHTYTFDANNNRTSELLQNWNGSAWENYYKHTYTYDANNNLTSELVQYWTGGYWENSWQDILTYDINNNLISVLEQDWTGDFWENSYQFTYTYDANNNQTSSLSQSWNGSTWENSSKDIYTYDADNNLISYLWQHWNGISWENIWQFNYTYDTNNNLISGLLQDWNGSSWDDFIQFTYTYDANNNLMSDLMQRWNGSTWVIFTQYTYTYDADNFTLSYSDIYWNDAGSAIEGGDSTYYYFHTVLGMDDLMALESNITVYPNPGNGKFTISSNSNISSLEIYNLLGELVYSDFTFNRQTSTEIDLTKEPNGIYFAKISNGAKTYTRKIIVQ